MVPLNVHSNYSFLEGTASVPAIIEKAKELNLYSLALTDTNGMYGLIEFAKKAAEANIKPLLGTMITEDNAPGVYALFIARNLEGYADICRIITTKKLKKDFSLFKLLQEEYGNLFIITPSIELLKEIPLYDNIYAELISTPCTRRNTRLLYQFAQAKGLKYIASNPVYFLNKEDYFIQKTVSAIKSRNTIYNIAGSETADEEFYFKGPAELEKLWRKIPQAIYNTHYIAGSCNVDLEIGTFKYPVMETGNPYSDLWQIAFSGLEKRYVKITGRIRDRLKYELEVIFELHLANYFLMVLEIVKEAKKRGMIFIGRGSAANSMVSYCLGFTEVDPMRYDLYFERFLNKSRSVPPDIDLDFSWKERDEIVKFVFDRFGYDKVAMISTHVTMQGRSAFRETAKAFGLSDEEISKYSKYIPHTSAQNLPHLRELFPESRSLKLDDEPWKTIVNIASRLADTPRHISIHPSGIIISPKPVTNYTALEFAKNKGLGLIITQPDMYSIEDIGLIKIDLLSQRSLGVLRTTINKIESYNREEQNYV